MKKNLIIILMVFFTSLNAQDKSINRSSKTPKYILRQKDFYEKRVSPQGGTNFASAFYRASLEKEKLRNKSLNKKSNYWTPLGPFGKDDLAGIGRVNDVVFDPNDTAIWYICVAQGGIWRTANSGKSWFNMSGNLPILRTSSLAVHPVNSDTMYVALGDYAYLSHNIYANGSKRNSHYGLGIYKTVDRGITWQPTGLSFAQTDFEGSLIQRIIIHPKNHDKLIAVGQRGSYYSSDAGENWQKTDSGMFWDLEIDVQRPDRIYATTGFLTSYNLGEAGILYSNDFGLTWNKSAVPFKKTGEVQRVEITQAPSDPAFLYGIACSAESAGLDDGFFGFYQSTDTGKTWKTIQSRNYQYNLLGWDFDATPGGQGKYDLAIVVDMNNKYKVSTGGVNLWTTSDGGITFLPATHWRLNYQRKSLHADIHSLRQHPGGRVFACHDGGLSASNEIIGDDPVLLVKGTKISTLWTHFTAGLNITSFYRLGVNSENASKLMAGAQDNSTSTMSGNNWFNLSGGDGMECTFAYDNFLAYTSSQYGSIYRYNFDLNSGEFIYDGSLDAPFSEQGEWTTPFVAVGDKLYAGYGNLYFYEAFDNAGQNLTNFTVLPSYGFPKPISSIAISKNTFQVASRIYLAKRSYPLEMLKGEVWVSKDGTTWKDISGNLPLHHYPTYLYTLDKSGDEVWLTFSGFEAGQKVYYSENAGDTWKNISYNLPNIPVNCVAVQEDQSRIVYVGTDHGVYYLDKTKNEWVLYSDNLPNVIVSELEIHAGTNKLLAATFGGGIWQTDLLIKDSIFSIKKWQDRTMLIKINPNPATDKVALEVEGLLVGEYRLQVLDITGKTVLEKIIDVSSTNYSEPLDVHNWLTGEYFVVLEKDNSRIVGKFIKL